MLTNLLRSLWSEPREPNPPRRVWRDWQLVGVLVLLAILEGLLREDLVWRPVAIAVQVPLLIMLLWRRTHPLISVAAAFGGLGLLEIATTLAGRDSAGLYTMVGLLFLPYALFRWGSGRDAAIGLVVMSIPHAMNMVFNPSDPASTAAGFAFLLFPAALGASVRFRARARRRDFDEAKLLEREQLARELHDAVAHHVSAIVIHAQAGRLLAASDPDAAQRALATIESEASRTLGEMRSIVGVLRRGEAEHAPQRRLVDLEMLAHSEESSPAVEVEFEGDLDDVRPAIQAAIFRIAQESITNARRHARHATEVTVRVVADADTVALTVTDDGDASYFDADSDSGYGIVGMTERATLHGGTLEAGPGNHRGWTVRAVLPKAGRAS
ncbi:MAG TPA: histidine kinase [Acidimicrobiia bacterium]|nr:histidine kinase [Acidimicrobiia bacterium]